jgi:hypothetical protein
MKITKTEQHVLLKNIGGKQMQKELKFGDRVKVANKDSRYSGQEGVFLFDDGTDFRPLKIFLGADGGTECYSLEELEILPKTRLEIMKDMIDGHKFIDGFGNMFGFINNEDQDPYFSLNGRRLCDANSDGIFKGLIRLPNPIKKPLKDFNILETEVTAEQAARIKEIIEGVK